MGSWRKLHLRELIVPALYSLTWFACARIGLELTQGADGIAAVMATGRSDYPNQINNVLAFPGIFRGALDVHATEITESMKLAAAQNIASVIGDDLAPDNIIPSVFDKRVLAQVAPAVSAAAVADGVTRNPPLHR